MVVVRGGGGGGGGGGGWRGEKHSFVSERGPRSYRYICYTPTADADTRCATPPEIGTPQFLTFSGCIVNYIYSEFEKLESGFEHIRNQSQPFDRRF